jgi:hypothetical protein
MAYVFQLVLMRVEVVMLDYALARKANRAS